MVEKIPNECLRNCKGVCGFNEPDSPDGLPLRFSCTAGIYVYYSHSIQTTNNKQTINKVN
jgi:hypothetical protein